MLWSSSTPSIEALQIALDAMPFEQWLQFIFIPKMSEIVSTESTLPDNFKLLPMAEQSLGNTDNQFGVIEVIKQIDLIFAVS